MARNRKKKSNFAHGDVSIADYADNEKTNSRISKFRSIPSKANNAAAELHDEQSVVEDVDLDEETSTVKPSRRRKDKCDSNDDQHVYNEYHVDVWDAIARHIHPEDVSRFSRICQSTAYICRTVKFWKQLYHRVYCETPNLPVRLHPVCMVRRGGLRTCTIRSLFYMYPPLKQRLAKDEQQSITDLRRRECIATWLVRVKDKKHYCFKLKEPLMVGSRMDRAERLRRENVFEKVNRDIFQNADEGCKLLVVKMSALRPLPELFGQESYLHDVKMSLSTGCVKHRLTMEFVGSGRERLASIVYEPVDEVRVLDWWTPAYHSYEANIGSVS